MKKVLAYGLIGGLAIGGASLAAVQAPAAPQGAPAGQGQAPGGGRGGGGGGRGGGRAAAAAAVAARPWFPRLQYKAGIPEQTAQDMAITNARIIVGNGR